MLLAGFQVGDAVYVLFRTASPARGVLRYSGHVHFASGVWAGVELAAPRGKNDGSIRGVSYFRCGANHGLFVRPSQLELGGGDEDVGADAGEEGGEKGEANGSAAEAAAGAQQPVSADAAGPVPYDATSPLPHEELLAGTAAESPASAQDRTGTPQGLLAPSPSESDRSASQAAAGNGGEGVPPDGSVDTAAPPLPPAPGATVAEEQGNGADTPSNSAGGHASPSSESASARGTPLSVALSSVGPSHSPLRRSNSMDVGLLDTASLGCLMHAASARYHNYLAEALDGVEEESALAVVVSEAAATLAPLPAIPADSDAAASTSHSGLWEHSQTSASAHTEEGVGDVDKEGDEAIEEGQGEGPGKERGEAGGENGGEVDEQGSGRFTPHNDASPASEAGGEEGLVSESHAGPDRDAMPPAVMAYSSAAIDALSGAAAGTGGGDNGETGVDGVMRDLRKVVRSYLQRADVDGAAAAAAAWEGHSAADAAAALAQCVDALDRRQARLQRLRAQMGAVLVEAQRIAELHGETPTGAASPEG